MPSYGFHASHEQIAPSRLLRDVQQAERAGFDMAMCSDHFAPWSVRQGHSGFAWSWLGAALATTQLRLGTVNAPGQRYHPAVIAQASATLAEMFPGRFWVALGTGQNMNEHITGDKWIGKDLRQERLEECVEVIRRLHAGEDLTYRGRHVTVERARVYSLPATPPKLIGPALSPATAARAATWADGLITINTDLGAMREIVEAYRENGGSGPLALQVHLSIAPTQQEARDIARDQWQNHPFAEPIPHDTATPEDFDIIGRFVPDEVIAGGVVVTASVAELVERLRELESLGFDEVYLHHVGQDQGYFLELARHDLLPALRS
ncbi:TIGR03885 family FMN-dependent LLM class oxidoreductase [uncultured Georgenia sp.]|uniref:TIGR03885 family FMN-dependent LLM class oxidoreductase n=1 Tax=uncultured Georgenia sp. TaxID=378209 RepID=UPI00260B5038|nr:TIGR03885 family FMN-dependent LLM class oxidoreductase [uncultured Georgenia sp.]HLV04431.1 TIGR03885 family FMN-dependent LLM class oxidoreductase [Actinomycetaceae bacterium]